MLNGHLGMHFDAKQSAQLAARPAGAGADDAPPTDEEIRFADRRNHGITQLKVLPGNIRYLESVGFFWGDKTKEAYDNAMRFLRDGDVIIIDLRRTAAGAGRGPLLISHFLEPNRPIVTFYMHGNPAEKLTTLASLPAGRLTGKPLYVLTSGPQRQRSRGVHRPCRRLQGGELDREDQPARVIATSSSPSPAAM